MTTLVGYAGQVTTPELEADFYFEPCPCPIPVLELHSHDLLFVCGEVVEPEKDNSGNDDKISIKNKAGNVAVSEWPLWI